MRWLLVLLLASSPAFAAFRTGNELVKMMREYERFDRGEEVNIDHCAVRGFMAFVMAVHDTTEGIFVCSGERITVGQVSSVVVKWMHAHPEMWNRTASDLVLMALKEAFPCKATKKTGAPSPGHGETRLPAAVLIPWEVLYEGAGYDTWTGTLRSLQHPLAARCPEAVFPLSTEPQAVPSAGTVKNRWTAGPSWTRLVSSFSTNDKVVSQAATVKPPDATPGVFLLLRRRT